MSKKRLMVIDNLYALGVILVVLGHSHSSNWSTFEGTVLNWAITFIHSFHMPLFFFIAGFLFMNSDSLERNGYGKWIWNKVVRLMTPYVVLSLVAMVPKYIVEHHGFSGFTAGYFLKAVFVPRVGVWGHFWFLPVLLITYVLFGIWKRFVVESNCKVVLAGTFIISILFYFLPYDTDWLGFSDLKKSVVFFVIGVIVNKSQIYKKDYGGKLKRNLWMMFVTALSILLVYNLHGNRVVMLIVAVAMISACWQLAVLIGENKFTVWVSEHNFTIYIYSWLFQSVVMVLCDRFGVPWYVTTFGMFISGLGAPSLMIWIYEKVEIIQNRFLNLVLGMK